ncbi:hypothetical protein CIB84_007995, partial [Bambusicola thoracicus]
MATRGGRSRCRSQADRASPGTAEQPSGAGSTSLLASATTWPLKRYGRFLSPTDSEDGERSGHSWKVTAVSLSIFLKVFESNEESGHLILTIVVSGHFFISQGRTVLDNPNPQVSFQALKTSLWNLLSKAVTIINQNDAQEGFSLIDAQKWLRIARRADCLLLHAQSK